MFLLCITIKIIVIILLIFYIVPKIFDFRLKDENNLPKQFFLLLKNIWYCENTMISIDSINIDNLKQMTIEEIHFLIISTETKIGYLQVCNINIYL